MYRGMMDGWHGDEHKVDADAFDTKENSYYSQFEFEYYKDPEFWNEENIVENMDK
jgi:hypothetical protein